MANDGDDGDADHPADQRPGRLAEALVGELLGQLIDPSLGAFDEILLADPVADQRQPFELADRVGELLGELLRLGDGAGASTAISRPASPSTTRAVMATANAAAYADAALDDVDDRVEGEGDQQADADAREHRRRVGEHGEHGEHDQHGDEHGQERRPVELEPGGDPLCP